MSTKTNTKNAPLHFGTQVTLTDTESASVRDAVTKARGTVDKAYAESVSSTAAGYAGRERKARALARVFGAVAVHTAIQSGLIGDGGMSQTEYAEKYGVSKANVTALKTLGLAVSKGFGPEFPAWPTLSDKAGNKAYREAVEKATDGKSIAAAVEALSAKKTGTPKVDDGSGTGNAPTGSEESTENDGLTPFEACKASVKVLRDLLPVLDGDQFSAVESMLTDMLAATITARVESSKAA